MQPSQNFASHQVHVAAGHIKDVPFDGYIGMQTIHSLSYAEQKLKRVYPSLMQLAIYLFTKATYNDFVHTYHL